MSYDEPQLKSLFECKSLNIKFQDDFSSKPNMPFLLNAAPFPPKHDVVLRKIPPES